MKYGLVILMLFSSFFISCTAVAVSLGTNVTFNVNGTIPEGKDKYIARAQIAAVNSINSTFNFRQACSFVKFTVNTNSIYDCRIIHNGNSR